MIALLDTRFVAFAAALLLAGCTMPGPRPGDAPWQPAPVLPSAPSVATAGSLFSATGASTLFVDLRARHVGDVLTVQLVERTNAQKRADTQIVKDSEINGPEATVFGEGIDALGVSASLERQMQSQAQSLQSNQLQGAIAVTVQAVQPNGNLLVAGEKWVSLNQGDEFIRVSGVVRAVDVGTDNSILSTQIADARIEYSGRGAVAESNRPGLLARFFINPLWPF